MWTQSPFTSKDGWIADFRDLDILELFIVHLQIAFVKVALETDIMINLVNSFQDNFEEAFLDSFFGMYCLIHCLTLVRALIQCEGTAKCSLILFLDIELS